MKYSQLSEITVTNLGRQVESKIAIRCQSILDKQGYLIRQAKLDRG